MKTEEQENELNPYQKSLLPFDPIVLLRDASRKWLLILVVALIVGMVAFVYTDSGYVPAYSTSCTLVLTTRDSSSTVYDNLDSTSSLANVFSEVLNSSVMRRNIYRELGMGEFPVSIYASAIESTNLLTVYVSAEDPSLTFQVMQVLLEQHEMVTYAVMGDIVLEVLQPPTVPYGPYNSVNSVRAFLLAAAAAAAVVFLLLLVLAYFRDTVRSKEEAEEKLNCWCLGEIRHERKKRTLADRMRRKKRGILLTDPQTGFRYVTTMSKLARRVEQNMRKGKILLVTSVMENEGKSTVAANLALALSKKYSKVLLVDCDLHKPACRKILEHEVPRYFTQNVIRGEIELAEAVQKDRRSRMSVLFAKHCPPQEAGDLIGSSGMSAMLEKAREDYDYVIIDLPPMSIAPDTEAVMEFADASLLVVRQNGVLATDLNRAISDLQRGRAKLLGCVLNNVHTTDILSGEGYGTGYGQYGRYGRYGRYAAYAKQQSEEKGD